MRVAVVDTGDELMGAPELAGLSVDVLSGYPKAEGIRIATSYMNPQVIVCDEISNDEAEAVSGAQNCGVALIASAHGADAASLLKRSGMRTLYEVGAFSLYVRLGISRDGFSHRVHRREEIAFAYGGNDSRSD
jgi:stage III sporulation protein AA